MSLKKHILVISQYFYPEQFRINDICSEWVKRGYKVTVLTGIPNYPQGKYFDGYGLFKKRKESYHGVDIIRIPLIPRGSHAVLLAFNYLSFVISGLIWKVFTRVKADYVFIFEVSPMTQALPGVWYAKKRKIPCYLYVQDLWPENVEIITGVKNKHVIGSIGKMVDYIYKRCNQIFATSESFVGAIQARGVPLDKITYWPQYAEDFYVPLDKKRTDDISDDDCFNIIFAGNIGSAQGLDILPKAAEYIKNNSKKRIRFHIVGDGRYKSELIHLVDTMGLKDMFNYIPKQPAEKIPEYMAASEAAFLSLTNSPLFEMTIPAKLQSYMACGIPIIASAAGETEKIIGNSKSGFSSKPGNPIELATIIIKIACMPKEEVEELGKNARLFYEENFSKQLLLDKIDHYFK